MEARVMRRILAALALVAGYVVISSLCHYVLFPEPGPDPSDLPRRDMTIVNEGIRSTFVYRQTSIETAGRLFEWESLVEPGGGPIAFRWQPGTTALPPHCLGHIGYAVVPWKQRLGYATLALRKLLPEARAEGLPFVELITDPPNFPSQRVILANGGVFVERFTTPPQFGNTEGLRYRITLA